MSNGTTGGFVIPLQTRDNFTAASKRADRYADSLTKLGTAMKALPPGTIVGGASGGGGVPGTRSSKGRLSMVNDPWTKQAMAMQDLKANPGSKSAFARATKQVQSADKLINPVQGALGAAVGGGRLSSVMGALGLGAEIAAPIAITIGAVALFGKAVEHAATQINDITTAKFGGGGSMSQTSNAVGLGMATGKDIISISHAISDQIMSNGAAASDAARLGIPLFRGKFGNIDDTSAGLKVIKDIVGDPSDANARRRTRSYDGAIPEEMIALLRAASPGVQSAALNYNAVNADPKALQEAADAQIQLNMALGDFSKLVTGLGADVLPTVNLALKSIVGGMGTAAQVGLDLARGDIAGAIGDSAAGAIGAVVNGFGGSSQSGGPIDENAKATRANTAALNRVNTNLEQGHYGASFGDSTPGGWGYRQMQDQANGAGIPLGVW